MNNIVKSSELQSVIVKIKSHNADTGFSVLLVKPTDEVGRDLVKENTGKSDYLTVVGTFFNPMEGGYVTCNGTFVDSTYGRQFKAKAILITSLTKKHFAEDALRSRFFSSISKEKKEMLISKYHEQVLVAIGAGKIIADGLVSSTEAERLQTEWKRVSKIISTFDYLRGLGISVDATDSIIESFGNFSKEIISSDPYRLLVVSGVGFANMDAAAKTMRIGMTSSKRISYGFSYIIKRFLDAGHTGFYLDDMVGNISTIMKLDNDFVRQKLIEFINSGHYMMLKDYDRQLIVHYDAYKTERECAKRLVTLSYTPPSKIVGLVNIERGYLKEGQIKAIHNTLRSKLSIITGGPGVGKTTVLNYVLNAINEATGGNNRVLLAAPTGQAAEKMTSSTGIEAETIHKLLEFQEGVGFLRDENNKLECDTIAIDELSMIDIYLFHSLLKAIPDHAKVIFLGDIDQLPSIGPGAVLRNLIESRRLCVSRLTEQTRFGKLSQINSNAYLVNDGKMPDIYNKKPAEFHWVECIGDAAISEAVKSIVCTIPSAYKIPVDQIQILSPQKGTLVGVDALNKEIRKIANPKSESSKYSFMSFGFDYRVNDRIMVTKNSSQFGVNNGQLGKIKKLDFGSQSALIDFSGKEKILPFSFFCDVKHAYAKSIHKSQGSEYSAVIVIVSESHMNMLNIELLFTAMTRAKCLLFMVGSSKALEKALQNKGKTKRITLLDKAIEAEFSDYHNNKNYAEPSYGR